MYFIVKMWLTPVRVVISDKLLKNIHNLFLNMKQHNESLLNQNHCYIIAIIINIYNCYNFIVLYLPLLYLL